MTNEQEHDHRHDQRQEHGNDHRHEPGNDHKHGHGDEDALADMLDLDAEVLHEYLDEVTSWLRERAGDRTRRILDLGSGTGTGTLALATRFPGADVTAVDMSETMLQRVARKAQAHQLAERVHPLRADLDAGWPPVGSLDLVWAAGSLHHLADPDRMLAEVFGALRPGGLLAAVEMAGFPTFLPDDLGIGQPGLEERCHATLHEGLRDDVPLLGTDWGPRLRKAGFTVEAERPFVIALTAPLPAATGRYAEATLRRLRTGLGDRLAADDLATLDTLLDGAGPDSIRRRADLTVRTTRTVWLAVRL